MVTHTNTHKTAAATTVTEAWWCYQRFWVFRGGVAENSVLLGDEAMLIGKGALTFRGTVLRSKQRDVITHWRRSILQKPRNVRVLLPIHTSSYSERLETPASDYLFNVTSDCRRTKSVKAHLFAVRKEGRLFSFSWDVVGFRNLVASQLEGEWNGTCKQREESASFQFCCLSNFTYNFFDCMRVLSAGCRLCQRFRLPLRQGRDGEAHPVCYWGACKSEQ